MACSHPLTESDENPSEELLSSLSRAAKELKSAQDWPRQQLADCGREGVYRWFLPPNLGGWDWNERQIAEGYLKLSSACLTTTFIITQRTGACRRIAGSQNEWVKEHLLPPLVTGESFATVGISHLTTSRRHLAKPVLTASEVDGGFVLDGFSPWVTGGPFADHIVLGATLDDGRQLLVAAPTDRDGISCAETPELVGLSASRTGRVNCDQLFVESQYVIAGPIHDVMNQGQGAATGGTQTSTLALGLAESAIAFLEDEADRREDLQSPTRALREELTKNCQILFELCDGTSTGSNQQLRQNANSLVLRSTQAALTAAKGSGYVVGHPAGRWCQEALFFLVWSCPQPVVAANLCEFAGITDG